MNGPHQSGDCLQGRYDIIEFHGKGGMQYVYRAHDRLLNREVALKTPQNDSAQKRFKRSAVVAAKVNHPNVAKTLDYFEQSERAYLIEEFVAGDDLANAILTHVDYLDPFLLARIFHNLAKGLAASHHAGVIHRDLKPTNIMVTDGFNLTAIKLTDFGIAKMAEQEMIEAVEGGEESMVASATAVGAIPYMSPEAINTPQDVTTATDIWSLGAMMYELLVGQRPFGPGLQAVHKIVTGQYCDPPSFIFQNIQFTYLAQQLIDLIKSCLSIEPNLRPDADSLVRQCGDLCYPVSKRYEGKIKSLKHRAWGFIEDLEYVDVFYHVDNIYGDKPAIEEKVMFSKFDGGGADRAFPVVRMKQSSD